MAGTKKYKTPVSLAVNTDEETRDKLTDISEKRQISRADLVNEIIHEYLERQGK